MACDTEFIFADGVFSDMGGVATAFLSSMLFGNCCASSLPPEFSVNRVSIELCGFTSSEKLSIVDSRLIRA